MKYSVSEAVLKKQRDDGFRLVDQLLNCCLTHWHGSAQAFPFGEGGLAKQGRMRVILEQNHIAEGNKLYVCAESVYFS